MASGGKLVVSLDFELNWGVRDQVSLDRYGANLHGARKVIPRLLERFEAHGVRATWATVGMLFCETKEELLARMPERRPAYARAELSPYPHLDAVGADERADPLHFAPSLVRRIAASDGQEVATHTFSHFYCLEPGQTAADFEADLRAAADVARAAGIELRSIVFPRNQVNPAYLPVCADAGLIAYRGNPSARVHSARSAYSETALRRAGRLLDAYVPLYRNRDGAKRAPSTGGLVDVPASRFLRPRPRSTALARLEPRKIARVIGEMERAAKSGALYHLWWHPHNFGVDQELNLAGLDAILRRFSELRDEGAIRSLSMAEMAQEQRAA